LPGSESRILLTQDKDFGELVYRLQTVHFGIILIQLGNQSAVEKAALINDLLT
jgi:predicted nuclease of predicted toxin-antitoxin system